MAERKYGWGTCYETNVFGADEHYTVTLYRLNKRGTTWKEIASWSYSTFMQNRLAHARAERRIRKLRNTYDAKAI